MTDEIDTYAFRLNDQAALADPCGALFLSDLSILTVSDLHFEKGSAFAAGGQMLPPYDTRATLAAIEETLTRHAPRTVIALGDSFHDAGAFARMTADDRQRLSALLTRVERWIWIEGNHDPAPPPDFGGDVCAEHREGGLFWRHEPGAPMENGEIAGHLHPCAKISGSGRSMRRRCFATDGRRLVMPALGAFTGGLNVCDTACTASFDAVPDVLMMSRDRVLPVRASKCRPDRTRTAAGVG